MTTVTVFDPIHGVRKLETRWLSCAETAKLIRKALRLSFPGIRFSVRSHTYSGGASIDVKWTDGPTPDAVESVAKGYAGAGFDGMIDMKHYSRHWLMPDGSVTLMSDEGTAGSRGTVPRIEAQPAPSPDAVPVRFGTDFVFCTRDYSARFLGMVASVVDREAPELTDTRWHQGVIIGGRIFQGGRTEIIRTIAHDLEGS